MLPIEERVAIIFQLLKSSEKKDYIGEPVSQLQHSLQCAHLAKKMGFSDEDVLAALLHDIGHLWENKGNGGEIPAVRSAHWDDERVRSSAHWDDGLGVRDHEHVGAQLLTELGFSKNVSELVRDHVRAKRYLVFKNQTYLRGLSSASRQTLELQGGPMDAAEAAEFERDPLFKAKIRLRGWDEQAKTVDYFPPPLESYKEMVVRHLTSASCSCN